MRCAVYDDGARSLSGPLPDNGDLAAAVIDRLVPLATSHLIIENDFVTDLEPELWNGDEVTASITRAGAPPR